jgi:hypothetical protein
MTLSELIRTTGKTTDLDAVTYTGKEYQVLYASATKLERVARAADLFIFADEPAIELVKALQEAKGLY